MFGFVVYLLYVLGRWMFGDPVTLIYPDAAVFLFRWYIIWAAMGAVYYLVVTLIHAGLVSSRKEGSALGSFLSRGFLNAAVWFLQYATVLLGAYTLGLGLVAGVWVPMMILAGLLLLLMGWVIQAIVLIIFVAS